VRLAQVERGDSLKSRLLFAIVRVVSGFRLPDVVRTLRYRAGFFGEHHASHTHEAMRGTSAWSVGERELMAAFVSKLNECRF